MIACRDCGAPDAPHMFPDGYAVCGRCFLPRIETRAAIQRAADDDRRARMRRERERRRRDAISY